MQYHSQWIGLLVRVASNSNDDMDKHTISQGKKMKPNFKALRDQSLNEWCLQSHKVPSWLLKQRAALIQHCQNLPVHGFTQKWLSPIQQLRKNIKNAPATTLSNHTRAITRTTAATHMGELRQHLETLRPWRKGPWQLNNIEIQSEWDSSIKYQRLQDYGPTVRGKTVLDIGSGNGYYGFRMLGDGADYVLGIDPAPLFWAQFMTFQSFTPMAGIDLLPMTGEPLLDFQLEFDLVFSMGVLYHRRNPLDHLKLLRSCLKNDGELLLETLVIDDQEKAFLMPETTYAGMSNVWGLPSVMLLMQWLKVCGFKNIKCVSLSLTSPQEQAQTPWIATHTLEDFLTPDGKQTKEGLPPPLRAMIRAQK